MNNKDIAIQIAGVTKEYRIGVFNHLTLRDEITASWAKLWKKKDPSQIIGDNRHRIHGKTLCALDDVSLTIHKGESVGIIGANGAGKSTLLKLVCRVTAPTRGTIGINGRISSMLEVGVGFMPELTGRENIYLSGAILGMGYKEITRKIDAIAKFSECEDFMETPLKRYSSGMRVKLGFSIAAHLDNEIMIMDEVLAVGDLAFQRKCLEHMSNASAQDGKTILYVSHNMNTIRQLCTRCIVLNEGKVIFDGDMEKAISLYCDQLATFYTDVDLRRTKRYTGLTGALRMTRIRIADRETAQLVHGEKIRFIVNWTANQSIQSILPMVNIRTIDRTAVTWMRGQIIEDVKEGCAYETELELNTSELELGEYSLALVMADPEEGHLTWHDSSTHVIHIEVISSENRDYFSAWRRSTDGFFAMSDKIRIVENKIIS